MEIKPGDLVMIVKPRSCCGIDKGVGLVFTVSNRILNPMFRCPNCGAVGDSSGYVPFVESLFVCERFRLKKIDPPSEGDSLPTRADLKLEA